MAGFIGQKCDTVATRCTKLGEKLKQKILKLQKKKKLKIKSRHRMSVNLPRLKPSVQTAARLTLNALDGKQKKKQQQATA